MRSVSALLHSTRERQRALRAEREQAREALKSLIHQMLQQVGELGSHTGRFTDSVARYADVIEHADSLESLAGAVREMVAESRTVQDLVGAAQQRLQDEHARAQRPVAAGQVARGRAAPSVRRGLDRSADADRQPARADARLRQPSARASSAAARRSRSG